MKKELFGEKIIKKFEEKGLSENFCIVPFTTLQLEADGNVNMCRQKGTEFSIGNIKEKSIAEIWNDSPIKKIREEFLTGNISTCKTDIENKNCNLCTGNNKIFENVELETHQSMPIQRLGFNINGFCNLECQMCHVWKMPNGLYTDENFWNFANNEIFPHLKELELLSGEPFLQKDTYKLINIMSELNPLCKWIFTTNAHWKLNEKIKADLNKIDIRDIIVSIDSVNPSTYSRIRKKGDLNIVLENLDRIIMYNLERKSHGLSEFGLKLNFLIQKDNWKELGEILEFCENKKGVDPFITFLYEPEEFSLLKLTKKEINSIIESYLDNFTSKQVSLSMRVINPLMRALDTLERKKVLLKLTEKISS